jgi:hypothetical protein
MKAPTRTFGSTVLALALLLTAGSAAAPKKGDDLRFTDVARQTAEFIGYYKSIQLSPEQEAVKKEALTALPAPCCSDNTAFTCCCPCNSAKAWWGLSHYLIARKGYNAAQVKTKVAEWFKFINPSGFPGDTCSTGGCGRPFHKAGCGGMGEKVVF